MLRYLFLGLVIWSNIFLYQSFLYSKIGVSFGPGEITFGNLEIGQSYDFGKLSSQQFYVINKSSHPVDVVISPFLPKFSTKKGFLLLPNLSWIKVYPSRVTNLEPGKKYTISLKLKIPDNNKYLGKNYMFFLQAKVVSGGFWGIGASSRVLIKIKKNKTGEKLKYPSSPADFNVIPSKVVINNVTFGKKGVYSTIEIKNNSKRKLTFEISLLSCKQVKRPLWKGYSEFPGFDFSKPTKNFFTLEPGHSIDVDIKFQVDKKLQHKGRKIQLYI